VAVGLDEHLVKWDTNCVSPALHPVGIRDDPRAIQDLPIHAPHHAVEILSLVEVDEPII
jgi:hypothetical protein